MDNKGLLRGIIILLVISLGTNIMTYKKAEDLEQKVQALNNQSPGIEQRVNSSLSQMHNTLNQIKAQGDWISPVQLEVGEKQEDSTTVILSWQIKEYPVGAPVTLYYQLAKNEAFTPVTAVSTGGGNFTAELQVEKTFQEPEWQISYSGESNYRNNLATKHEQPVKELKVEKSALSNNQLTYYVTMQNGSKLLTSEQNSRNISKINQMTAPLNVSIHYRKDEYQIILHEQHDFAEVKIKSARLQVKESSTAIKEIPFTKIDQDYEPMALYQATYPLPENTCPDLTLHILYDNGETVEKHI